MRACNKWFILLGALCLSPTATWIVGRRVSNQCKKYTLGKYQFSVDAVVLLGAGRRKHLRKIKISG